MVRLRPSRRFIPWGLALAALSCGGGDELTLPSEGLPTAIAVLSGDAQTGVVAQRLDDTLVVRVTDVRDRPVQNQAVQFKSMAGGLQADLIPDTAFTDADGQARSVWLLGTIAGAQRVEARVIATGAAGALKVTFNATGQAEPADTVFVVKGAAQVGTVGALLADSLGVLVTDRFGNPVAGRTVTWSVPAGQGSVSAGQTTTGADGRTAVTRRLGPSAGTQTTTATATGLKGSPVTFSHTATAGGAAGLVKVSGDGQVAPAGFQLTDSLVVQVQDGNGNGVPGRTVIWVVTTGGGSVSAQSGLTDAQGFAYTFWNLGAIAGSNTLTAATTGLPQVTFTATGTSAQPTRIQSNSTISQIGIAGLAVAARPSVKVTDQNSNPVPGVSVTFLVTQGGGSVSDGTASGPSVSIATNASGVATLSAWTLGTVAGSNALSASAQGSGISGNPVSFTAGGVVGPAAIVAKNAGDLQSATAGSAVAIDPQVRVTDQFGNPVLGASVTFAVTAGGGSVLPATAVASDANGLAAPTSWTLGTVAGPNTLTASVPGLTAANFTATGTAGPATKLAFVTAPPVAAQSGVPLAPQPVVRVTDGFGNPVAAPGLQVVATLASGSGTLAGASAVTDAQGVASFTGLTISGSTGNYSLSFAAGLPGGALTSGTIVLGAGAATKVVITRQPSGTAQSGVAFATQPTAQLQDANGSAVGQSGVVITAKIVTGPAGGVVGNPTASTNANGLATFSGLAITGTVGSYTLEFSTTTGLTPAVSNGITVSAGPASQISFTVQPPPSGSSGVALTPNPVVQLRDAAGNAVNQTGLTILASIASGPAGATLSGSSAVTSATGAATFTNLRITGSAGDYLLHFVSPFLNDTITSGIVTLGAGAASKLAITTQPSSSVVNGAVFPTQPVIQLQDASGNPVAIANENVLVQVLSGTAVLGGTTIAQTNASGQAAFTNLKLTGLVGSNTLIFSASGYTSVNSSAINVTPGPPSALTLTTQPSPTAQSGVQLATQPVAQLLDQSGNSVSQPNVNVTVQIASGGGTLGGTTSLSTTGTGRASFSNLSISGAAGTRTLGFSSTSHALSGVTSNAIAVSAGAAAAIALSAGNVQTASVGTAVTIAPAVLVTDLSGNPVSGVAVTFAPAAGSGSVVGGNAITNASGIATVGSWTLGTLAGSNTLNATSAGLAGSPVTFTATGTAGQPTTLQKNAGDGQSVAAGTAVPVPPAVKVTDQFGNPVSGVSITFAVASGGGSVGPTTPILTSGAGVATVTSWTLGATPGSNTLTATAGPALAGSPALFTATGLTGAAAKLAFTTAPSTSAQSGVPLTTQPVVQVQDANGNAVAASGLTVTATILAGPAGTLTNQAAVTNANGRASFSGLTVSGPVGGYNLAFGSGSLTPVNAGVTLAAGPADAIAAASTTSQVATVGTAVGIPPSVLVTDGGGNPVSGVAVTFAPAPGSGSVTGGNATTNASGIATVGSWTIGPTAGTNTLTATASGLAGSPVTFTATGQAAAAASIALNAGNGQSAVVGTAVATAPSVIVRDASSNPVSGVSVTFAVTGGGGSVVPFGAVITGANGIATATSWTLGTTAGTNTLTATATGLTGSPVSFTATGIVGPVSASHSTASVPATGTAGSPTAITIQARDQFDNPLTTGGATVVVSVTGANTATPAVVNNGNGTYSTSYTPTATGSDNIAITLNGSPISGSPFTSVVGAGGAAAVAANSVTTQSATVGTAVAAQPSVKVTDAGDNPVAGVNVTFAVTGGGGSVTGANATTNASGIATVGSWTLGTTAGSNSLTATASGLAGSPVAFTATGTAGPASASHSTASVPGTGTAGSPTAITIQARDQFDNPLTTGGATVVVSVTGANTATPAVVNNGNGTYSTSYTPTATGSDNIAITLGGTPISGSPFTSVVGAGGAAAVAANSVTTQSATAGTAVAAPPSVIVTDAGDNPVAGVSVTFAVTGGGGSVVPVTAVITGANGIATATSWTLGTTAGTNTLTATASGLTGSPVNFTATGLVGPANASQSTASVPGTGTAGSPTAITVQARDQFDNPLTSGGATVVVSVTGANSATPTVVDNGNGTYTTSYTPTATGSDNITITLGGTPISGSPFTSVVGAGGAAAVAANSTTSQSATVGTAVATPPSVKVTDAGDNPVAGVSVTFAVTGGGGSVTGANATTNASGIATVGSWTLGTNAGSNSLSATVAGSGISGNPVSFSATGLVGAPSASQSTASVPGTGTAGSPTAITVQARDQFGNALASGGAAVVVSVTGANTATPTVVDNGDGSYSTSYTPTVAGSDDIAITLNGLPISGSPFTSAVAAGAAAQLAFGTEPTTSKVNQNITPNPTVLVLDSFGNLVTTSTASITVAIGTDPVGGSSLSGTLTRSAVAGVASFNGLKIDTVGNGFTLTASSPPLTGATSATFDISP